MVVKAATMNSKVVILVKNPLANDLLSESQFHSPYSGNREPEDMISSARTNEGTTGERFRRPGPFQPT